MPLSPLVAKLEVSEVPESGEADWIPLKELADRTAELPSKGQTVHLVQTGDFLGARELLEGLGRPVVFVRPSPGPPAFGRLWSPNPFLESCLPHLSPGLAIDLACGGGREAVALAGAGWRVTAVDILQDGLDRAARFADRHLENCEAKSIRWVQRDLVQGGLPAGKWDLATIFFFLDRNLLLDVPASLNRGGSLVVETFLEEHARVHGKPKSAARVFKEGELKGLFPMAEIVRYEEGPCRDRITVRAWLRF